MASRSMLVLAQVLAGVCLFGCLGFAAWLYAGGRMANGEERRLSIVAHQDDTLQAFAARFGGRFEPKHGVDAWGREVRVVGSVAGLGGRVPARLDFVTRSARRAVRLWFIPRLTFELPQGTRWAIETAAGSFVGEPESSWGIREAGLILGDAVREAARSGRTPDTFRKAFRVSEDSIPPPARGLLWSIAEHSLYTRFSANGLEVDLLPADLTNTSPFWYYVHWEGGYDVDELSRWVAEASALAAALALPAGP